MSTLSVTTINTANGTTDLTLTTGNTSGPKILVYSSANPRVDVANGTLFVHRVDTNLEGGQIDLARSFDNGLGGTIDMYSQSMRFWCSNNTGGTTGAQLSFGANASPTQMYLYANGQLTLAANTLALGTSTSAANGYTFLPNGLKMNWGTMVVNASSNAIFTSPFTTACYAVTVTPITASIYITANTISVTSTNTTQALVRSLSTTTTATAYYVAIGV